MGPGTDTARPLFRKNTLDEMTVGRTEKPVIGKVPPKPATEPGKRFSPLLEGQPERGKDDPRPIIRAKERADDEILDSSRGCDDGEEDDEAATAPACRNDGGCAAAGMIGAERRVPRRMRRRSKTAHASAALRTVAAATAAPATAAADQPAWGAA
jgi:hypothetical protein